jgi:hypothetical protein
MRRLSRPTRFLLFIPLFVLGVFVFGEIVMLLWNNVAVPVLNVRTVTFWQGLGILVLSKILFSSFGGRGGSRRDSWKQRMMWKNMTPEQKEKFKEECKNRSRHWGYKSWEPGDEPRQPESQV